MLTGKQSDWNPQDLKYVPESVQSENPDIPRSIVQKNELLLEYVPESVQLANPDIPLAATEKNAKALLFVPESVQLAHPHIPIAVLEKNARALLFVPEAVQLACPHIPLAAMKKNTRVFIFVSEGLKTNVEALVQLYTGTEEQLRSDLRLLGVEEGFIDKVANYYHHQIALSPDMIKEFIEPEYKQDIPSVLLPLIGEYISSTDDKKDSAPNVLNGF